MSQPAKILIVDDNPVVLFAVAHLLKAEGFAVLEATTGAEGLSRARAEAPDLVLLDVMLPDVNGVELCRQIKTGPDTRQLFVVNRDGTGLRQVTSTADLACASWHPAGTKLLTYRVPTSMQDTNFHDASLMGM